jgi:O-antigen ligase
VIILAGVFVSLSRMVIYGLIFVISLLVIFRYRLKGFIFVGVLGVFLVVLTINSPRFERLYNRGYTVIISDSTRFALWKGAVGIIKDYPIFGIGVHVFPKLIDHYTKGYPLDAKGHAHNAYLQMAINYGLPGLLFFLMVYGALAFRLYKSFRKTGNFWAFAGLIVLVMYMLEGLTENNFGDAEVTMYFWFMQGLIMGQVLEDNEKSGSWTSN